MLFRPAPVIVLSALVAFAPPSAASERTHYPMPGGNEGLPFSRAVMAGETLYVSGTLGLLADTGRPPEGAAEEARLVMEGVRAAVEEAGLSMADLVSVQVFCPDLDLYDTFNEVYRTYFEEGKFPARAFIGSGPLLRGARFEVQGIAVRPD